LQCALVVAFRGCDAKAGWLVVAGLAVRAVAAGVEQGLAQAVDMDPVRGTAAPGGVRVHERRNPLQQEQEADQQALGQAQHGSEIIVAAGGAG
jgi:hypothetical protein